MDENMDEVNEVYQGLSDGEKPILALDFDGVLHSYRSGWKGPTTIEDPPVPGAKEFIEEAVVYFQVHIHSSRIAFPDGKMAVAQWCAQYFGPQIAHRLHYDSAKPPAKVTLDDRAITFTGVWPKVGQLLDFQPWYRKGAE